MERQAEWKPETLRMWRALDTSDKDNAAKMMLNIPRDITHVRVVYVLNAVPPHSSLIEPLVMKRGRLVAATGWKRHGRYRDSHRLNNVATGNMIVGQVFSLDDNYVKLHSRVGYADQDAQTNDLDWVGHNYKGKLTPIIDAIVQDLGFRRWTLPDAIRYIAAVKEWGPKTVTLVDPFGETKRVKLTDLSEADQQFIQDSAGEGIEE